MINKPFYRITTPYGGWYETDSRGYVVRSDNGLDKTNSDLHNLMTWQIIGIVPIDNFGNEGAIVRLDNASKMSSLALLYKNGNPRYTIADIDHGTRRLHGNIKHHGVKTVKEL